MRIDKDSVPLLTAIFGAVLGFVGAVLGIINTWTSLRRDRLRVKVVPIYYFTDREIEGLGIEVTNLSFFSITINEIGFTLHGEHDRMTFWKETISGCELPMRMESRSRFTAYLSPSVLQDSKFSLVKKGYATTACGTRFTGDSPALQGFIKKFKRNARRHNSN